MEKTEVTNPQEPTRDKGGTWVQVGDKGYKVPPLNLKGVKQYMERLKQMASATPGPEHMAMVAEIAHAALQRNYPALTMDEVEEDLDTGNFKDVMAAVMGVSGLVKEAGAQGGRRTAANP